jgi:hypothetical protein
MTTPFDMTKPNIAIVPPSVNSATLMITIVSGGGAPPPVEGTRAAGCPLVLAV